MKTFTVGLCAGLALAASGLASAGDNPAWTFADLGYYRADSGDDATDGFRLQGSLSIAENFHVQAEYLDGTIGVPGSDVDFDGYRIVAGAHPSVGDATDAVINIQYFDLTYDVNPDEDVDGFGVGIGLRHMLAPNVEVSGLAWWNEGSDDDNLGNDNDFSDISLELGGRYLFTDNLSLGVTIVTNDSIVGGDSAKIDVRWQFDDLL